MTLPSDTSPATVFAPAKVNLFLHVGPVKSNGRHDLDSLVVFSDAAVADALMVEAAPALSLHVTGPFAAAAGPAHDNLVLRAARALQLACGTAAGARVRLVKNLPVAAGIGGGSSDAAAALKQLTALWSADPSLATRIAPSLGGDVPVALAGVPARMRGEGEQVTPVRLQGRIAAVLVNPGVACPTGPVFAAYDADGGGAGFAADAAWPERGTLAGLTAWLKPQRNDLEVPAITLVPEVAAVLRLIREQDGIQLARLSGSGATCFGLFAEVAQAERAASRIRQAQPGWWAVSTTLGAAP